MGSTPSWQFTIGPRAVYLSWPRARLIGSVLTSIAAIISLLATLGVFRAEVAPGFTPVLEAVPGPLCPAVAGDLGALVACLPRGTFVWNPPAQMKVGDRATLTARIGAPGVPTPSVKAGVEGPGTPKAVSIPVTSQMAVDLFSDYPTGLGVDTPDPGHRQQPLLDAQGNLFAEWMWFLTAKQVGTWQLRVKAYVSLDGQNLQVKEITALTKVASTAKVTVDPNPPSQVWSFVTSNWQWLIGLIVPGGFVTAVIVWLARRNAKPRPDMGPD
jgi:hypothetical protein